MPVNGKNGDKGHRRTQAERSQASRAALLTAARRLFAERGYAGTGREDIAEAAGLTRGALYHHFSGKPALFEAVYEQLEEELLARVVEAAMAAPGNPRQMLQLGCQAFLDAALDPAVQRIVLLDGPAVLSPDTRRRINESHALGVVQNSLEELMDAGALVRQPATPLAHVLLGALHNAADYVAHARQPRKARKEVGAAVDVLLNSLLD